MKHRYLSLTMIVMGVLLAGAGPARAQDWGIKGGVNFGDVAWGEEVVLDTKLAMGAVGGMFMRFQPAKVISLQLEALVSQVIVDFSSQGADVTNTLTNLQVPVLIRYTVFNGSSVRVRAQGGASFEVVLFAQENVSGATQDIRETVAPWGASFVVAGEVEWNRWVFDVRYVLGVTDIYQQEVAADFPARQRAVQVTAGFRF